MFPLPYFHLSNQRIEPIAFECSGPGIHQSLYLFESLAILAVRFDRSAHD